MLSSLCNDNEAVSHAPPPPQFARYASSSGPPPPLSRWRISAVVLAAPVRPSFAKATVTKSHAHKKPSALRVERREAPGRGPRHADGCCHPATLRAWRAPQKIRLREPPASGALRLPALHHHRGSPPRLSTAAARAPLPLRRRPASSAGALTASGMIRFHYRNISPLSSIKSYR